MLAYAHPFAELALDAWGPLVLAGTGPRPVEPTADDVMGRSSRVIWRSRAIAASGAATCLLYRWARRTRIERTVLRPLAIERARTALSVLRAAVDEDRRATREAWHLYARQLRSWRRAYIALALAFAGGRSLPLLKSGDYRVLPILDADCVADLIRWRSDTPAEWETRTNVFTALSREAPDDLTAVGDLRLCRTPASFHAATLGAKTRVLCVLDWSDEISASLVARARNVICDDEDHALEVDLMLKARRPKLPKLFVAGAAA